ncbi:MAG: DUF1906 domain-containing protein, partial [Coriobacteriia bacterium]|nr:DUF1906 domain-containing protein [Coriobacteriia bacterium]
MGGSDRNGATVRDTSRRASLGDTRIPVALMVAAAVALACALAPATARAADPSVVLGASPVAMPAATAAPGAIVIDYAGGYTSAAPYKLRRAGVGIVIRYVGASKWKSLTRAEANRLRANNIDVIAVYETSAGWMLGGYKAGVKAAKIARRAVRECGGPSEPFIYFACDVPTYRFSTVNACLRGAASVIGSENVGIYGSYGVCNEALKAGVADKAWQTIAWSSGRVLPTAALYQTAPKVHGSVGISDYDSNYARTDDLGQWAFARGSLTWQQAAPAVAETLTAIDFAPSASTATTAFAVGDGGAAIATTDGGATWSARTLPTTVALSAIDFADTQTAWVAGASGTMLRTTDGGATWVPQSSGTDRFLYGVSFADASTGTVVGAYGTLLCTADGGATWTPRPSGTADHLFGVSRQGTGSGTVVGNHGTVLRTT